MEDPIYPGEIKIYSNEILKEDGNEEVANHLANMMKVYVDEEILKSVIAKSREEKQ